MAQVELKQVYDTFTSCWKLYKHFSDLKGTDEYFDKLTTAASEIDSKFQSRLAKDLIMAVLDDLDYRAKNPGKQRICS